MFWIVMKFVKSEGDTMDGYADGRGGEGFPRIGFEIMTLFPVGMTFAIV